MHRKIPLPRAWKHRVRSSVVHVLCVAQSNCRNNGPLHGASKPVHRRARTPRVAVLEMCLQGEYAGLDAGPLSRYPLRGPKAAGENRAERWWSG